GEARARPEDRRGERGRRRLPIRRGDERRAAREPRREPVDRGGIELPQELAGQRGAAAGAREPREAADGPGGEDLGLKRNRGTHQRERSDGADDPSFG